MQLDDYLDFLAPNDIRLKGHRIGIETILLDYLELGLFPEDIVLRYPTLTLEEVYATITYYYRNQEKIDAYLREHKDTRNVLIVNRNSILRPQQSDS